MKTLSKRSKVLITAAAFTHWMATERPCTRNCKEYGSPVSSLILRPSTETKEMASGPNTPVNLMATGTKW